MNLKDAILETIKGTYQEAVNPELSAGFEGIDSDESQYRSLTSAPKDLQEYKFERSLRIEYWLYLTHPLARRIVDMTKEFVIGNGITFNSENERVQGVLDRFWYDYHNNLSLKQHQKVLELGLYGEQIYPVEVNSMGVVRLGYIDPIRISQVLTNPMNVEDVQALKIKGMPGDKGKKIKVIKEQDDGKLDGEAFFFRVNNASNALRGVSDILNILDWIDVFDQVLMNAADRERLLKSFVWDVDCGNMNEAQIKAYSRDQKPPKAGTVFYHNQQIKRTAITPDLKHSDSTTILKFILEFMLGGQGIPGHFFGFGQQTNKSTAQTMNLPFLKRLEVRQQYIKFMFTHIFNFVIDKAVEYGMQVTEHKTGKGLGKITEKDGKDFDIVLPEPSSKDMLEISQSLKELGTALTVAQNNGWITKETSAKIFNVVASEIGIDIDTQEEMKDLEDEVDENEKAVEDMYKKKRQEDDKED